MTLSYNFFKVITLIRDIEVRIQLGCIFGLLFKVKNLLLVVDIDFEAYSSNQTIVKTVEIQVFLITTKLVLENFQRQPKHWEVKQQIGMET